MRTRSLLFIISLFFTFHSFTFHSFAQSDLRNYKMAGPYEVVARDGEFRASKGGSERDMWTAWQCAKSTESTEQTEDTKACTTKALEIINAYAATLQRFDGHDAPLCCIQGYWLVRAMTILRSHATAEWGSMIRRAMLPTIDKFEADSPYANGNWGAIVNRCRMACAIFLEDSVMYQAAIDYYLHANDNGSLPNYVSETGQCQETGRDQGHAQLGLGAMCDICEMAWEGLRAGDGTSGMQGNDLWGALDNRLMKGIEYSAKYNLGYDVPFETWTDCTGLYNDWTEPGSMGRGRIRCIYDLPYNHFVKRKGLKMPYTKKLLDLQRKAEKRGEIQQNPEANQFTVKGVQEGKRLHQVFTYPAPDGAPLKHDYDVYVCPRGSKEWTKVDTYMAKVNSSPTPDSFRNGGEPGGGKHQVSEISYCVFDFTGDVFVRVISKNRKFTTARIRPDYRGTIANVQNDSTVQFLLFQPENVSVELSLTPAPSPKGEGSFKGEGSIYSITDNLLVFTSKPTITKEQAEKEAKAQGRKFQYYAPGFYQQDTIFIGSNTTVYLEAGSYFTNTFAINDAENVSILGRGIARPERGYEGAHVYRSKNVLIDGLVLNTCPMGESQNVTLHDVRSISHPSWGDGLNIFGGCSDILFDRVFCRNSDDCTTAYATRKGFNGNVRNVTMRNSTLWADVAHPIMIGLHGNSERGDTIEHLRYENIDILGQAEPQVDYQGCLAINCGDNNLVRDVVFDNIRIEQIQQGSILQAKVCWNDKYCTAPGRGIENITFRNIRYYDLVDKSTSKQVNELDDQKHNKQLVRSVPCDASCLKNSSARACSLDTSRTNLSIINGYNEQRCVRNITFEGLKINGRTIYDDMPGKPRWYKTADYVPIYVGNHVENILFKK